MLLPLSSTAEIKNLLVYVIQHYGVDGLSVCIDRTPTLESGKRDADLTIVYGDWRGGRIDIKGESQASLSARYFQEVYLSTFLETMKLVKLTSAQFYLGVGKDDLILTDIRLGPYKLTGPGMVRDIFGRAIKTQEVVKIEPLESKVLEAIERGFGSYAGDLIIKPSRFRTVERPEIGACPLYVEVRR